MDSAVREYRTRGSCPLWISGYRPRNVRRPSTCGRRCAGLAGQLRADRSILNGPFLSSLPTYAKRCDFRTALARACSLLLHVCAQVHRCICMAGAQVPFFPRSRPRRRRHAPERCPASVLLCCLVSQPGIRIVPGGPGSPHAHTQVRPTVRLMLRHNVGDISRLCPRQTRHHPPPV